MPGTVVVQTTADGSGAPVAVESLGGADYQLVKLVAGQAGVSIPIAATTGVPAAGSMGMVVALIPGASVTAQASGTVSVSNFTTVISGTVTVGNGISVTIQSGVSVQAVVSGTVSVFGLTTTASPVAPNMTGVVVWIAGGQSQTGLFPVDVAGNVGVHGTVAVDWGAVLAGAMKFDSVTGTTAQGVFDGYVVGTTGIPASAVYAPILKLAGSAQVSGTVSVSNTVVVTLATGGTLATLLGTVAVNVVAGGAAPGTTAATQTAVSAQVVWLAPTQTIHVTIDAGAGGGGSVTTAPPSISQSGQVVWIVGGQGTTAFPVVVTGTVSAGAGTTVVSVQGAVPVTTQASVSVTGLPIWFAPGALVAISGIVPATTAASVSVSGIPVWLNPTQQVVVSGLVGHSITGSVNIVSTAIVSLATGGSVTLVGTVGVSVIAAVSISAIVPVTTAASVSVSGIPVWLNPTQQVVAAVSGTVAISIPVSQALGTVITILGTQVVSVVPGLSVSAVISGTVAISIPVSQALGTVITILGTQIVSVVPMPSISTVNTIIAVSGVTSISNLSTVVTILGTQVVTLATGGTVAALDVGRTQVMLIISNTSVGISGTMMNFTAYMGLSQSAAGTTGFIIPAGKTFRVLSANILVNNSVTTSPVNHLLFVVASTAAPTWTSAVPIVAAVGAQATSATVAASACGVGVADVPAGATVGLAYTIGTSGGTLVQAVVNGYIFP